MRRPSAMLPRPWRRNPGLAVAVQSSDLFSVLVDVFSKARPISYGLSEKLIIPMVISQSTASSLADWTRALILAWYEICWSYGV